MFSVMSLNRAREIKEFFSVLALEFVNSYIFFGALCVLVILRFNRIFFTRS